MAGYRMKSEFFEFKSRIEELDDLWNQREAELKGEIDRLMMKRLFDQTISDLIYELSVEAEKMADRIESMSGELSRQWPDAFHMAYTMREKSALLKRAYEANVEKKEGSD